MDSADERKMIREIVNESNGGKMRMMINNEPVDKLDIGSEIDENMDDEIFSNSVDNGKADKKKSMTDADAITNDFREKVFTFIKCDDLIRKKLSEIKELKQKRQPCQDFIIEYLEKKDAPCVNVKDGKLIKNKSETKGTLNAKIIRDAITEGLKDQNLTNDDAQANNITTEIIKLMDSKRVKNVRINLKRTFTRIKKSTASSSKRE